MIFLFILLGYKYIYKYDMTHRTEVFFLFKTTKTALSVCRIRVISAIS